MIAQAFSVPRAQFHRGGGGIAGTASAFAAALRSVPAVLMRPVSGVASALSMVSATLLSSAKIFFFLGSFRPSQHCRP